MTSADRWDAVYRPGSEGALWDIGRPQPAVDRIADEGGFAGTILDSGCGTGENSLLLAERGFVVTGADWAPTAIERARDKARDRGLTVDFLVADALKLAELHRSFDTVLDCGLFHTFNDDDRARYVRSLSAVTKPGGVLNVLCFSDREPWGGGPRRITQQEIRDAFADGWDVREIEPIRFEARVPGGGADAWHATIERV